MLTRIWLLFRRLMQRLNRLIWLRRSRCLTRLTERQLKNLWQIQKEKKFLELEQTGLQLDWELEKLELMEMKASRPLDLPTNQETEQLMMDLQAASRQLTSMLRSSSSSGKSSRTR